MAIARNHMHVRASSGERIQQPTLNHATEYIVRQELLAPMAHLDALPIKLKLSAFAFLLAQLMTFNETYQMPPANALAGHHRLPVKRVFVATHSLKYGWNHEA
jgi:hypothetical protein